MGDPKAVEVPDENQVYPTMEIPDEDELEAREEEPAEEPEVEEQPEEEATEESFLSEEEEEALEAAETPEEKRKIMDRAFTQRAQRDAEARRAMEWGKDVPEKDRTGWGRMIDIFYNGSDEEQAALIRQLANWGGVDLAKAQEAAEEEEPTGTELYQNIFEKHYGKEFGFLAERQAKALDEILQLRDQRASERQKKLDSQSMEKKARDEYARAEEKMRSKYKDYDRVRPKIEKVAKTMRPAPGADIFQYLDGAYHMAKNNTGAIAAKKLIKASAKAGRAKSTVQEKQVKPIPKKEWDIDHIVDESIRQAER